MYRLITLGEPRLEQAGRVVELPLGKPFGVLVRLAVPGEPVARSALGRLLWPDAEPRRARQSVRQALSRLRRELGPDVLVGDDPVRVDGSKLVTDIAEVRAALSADDLTTALDLWRGPFLGGFPSMEAPTFERWAEEVRADLERRLSGALARWTPAVEEPTAARALAKRAASVAPRLPQAHRAHVGLLLAAGEMDAAASALEEAESALGEDVEMLGPLRDRLETLRAEREREEEDAPRLGFVNRTRELVVLTRAWERAAAGRRVLAMVRGPAGLGKTRLARALANGVRVAGGQVVWSRAMWSDREIELGLVAELVADLLPMPGAAGTSPASDRLLRRLVPSRGGDESDTGLPPSVPLTDALVDLLGAIAFEKPLLVVCDDMQWADPATIALLVSVARRLETEPVMLLHLYRADTASPEGLALEQRAVRELDGVRVVLEPLPDEAMVQLLVDDGLADPADAAGLYRWMRPVVGGNPLFLLRVVEELEGRGLADGTGRLPIEALPATPPLPEGVALELGRRLERVGHDAASLARVLGDADGPVPADRARAEADLPRIAFDDAVAELGEAGLLRRHGDRLALAHPGLRGAARRLPRGTRSRTPLWRRGPVRMGVVALLLVAILAVAAWGLGFFDKGPPYGGGLLLLRTTEGWFSMEPDGPPDAWPIEALPDTLPEALKRDGWARPARSPTGEIEWYVNLVDDRRGPDIGRIGPDGEPDLILGGPGDFTWGGGGGLSPDGAWIAYRREDTLSSHFRVDLMLARPDGSEERIIYAPTSFARGPYWSPDGQLLGVVLAGKMDTLTITSRFGEVMDRWQEQAVSQFRWCGGGIAGIVMRDRRHRLALFQPGDSEPRVYEGVAFEPLACSPDGTALVHAGVRDGRRILFITDLPSGHREPLPNFEADIVQGHWLPDRLPSVPARLDVRPDTLTLAWGERQDLRAFVHYSDGQREAANDVRWTTFDPGIASVVGGDRITANRPGSTRLVARWGPSLRDTAEVRVVGNAPATAVLSDSFAAIDTTRWIPVGWPHPAIDTVDGRPVLALRGDEKWDDGLVLAMPVSAERGLTVEVEARIPLTRRDYQDLDLCLIPAPATAINRETGQPPLDQATVCTRYPSRLGARFDSTSIQLWVPQNPNLEAFLDEAPGGRWFHLAIQIQPDGQATLWVDRERVLTAPVHVDLDPDQEWTVRIAGRAVGTEVHVRNLTIWTEPRLGP